MKNKSEGIKNLDALFTKSGDLTTNPTKLLGTFNRTESTRNFQLQFDHPQIPLVLGCGSWTGSPIRDKLRRECSCQAGLSGWLKKE